MSNDVPQVCCFVGAQEWRVQVAKLSDIVTTVMKGLRFADTQESCFQASKRSNMCSAVLVDG